MSPPRISAAAPLLHWLALTAGLALFTLARLDDPERVAALWVGALVGTALGQLLASRRIRLWLAAFVVGNLVWLGTLAALPLLLMLREVVSPPVAIEMAVAGFVPAALAGWLSLSERGALPAIWFPASLWTLALLDRAGGPVIARADGWLLLGGLVAVFLATLHAREGRRVALWQTQGAVRLAKVRRPVVLREAPLRPVTRVGFAAALGAVTLALTVWVAPRLFRSDEVASPAKRRPQATWSMPSALGPCCPDELPVSAPRLRVREYLSPSATHGDGEPAPLPERCVACRDGVPIGGPGAAPASLSTAEPAGLPAPDVASIGYPGARSLPLPDRAPAPEPRAASRPIPPPTVPLPAARPVRAVPAPPPTPTAASSSPWSLLAPALAALALHLALRVARRALVLRHLARPLWPETVEQRISNLWELVLVGLRDAGYRVAPGEQPHDLSRRVGLPGMSACADVLSRARHGVRVDAEDLAAMTRAARAAHDAARRHAGWAARALSWLRGPLA